MSGAREGRRSILVTGASRGLGFAAARVLASRGHKLMLATRSPDAHPALQAAFAGQGAQPQARLDCLDLASFASIRRFSAAMRERNERFDVILHNAGIIFAAPAQRLTEDGIEETLCVHAVGPLLLSQLLLPVLDRPARLVFVGSELHRPGRFGADVDFRPDDPNMNAHYHPWRAYKNSKLAQIWIAREWQRRYGNEGVQADVVCPGFVPATAAARSRGLQRFVLGRIMPLMPFANSLEHGAQILVQWCERPLDAPGGQYFDGRRIVSPSVEAMDEARAATFWAWAESATAGRP